MSSLRTGRDFPIRVVWTWTYLTFCIDRCTPKGSALMSPGQRQGAISALPGFHQGIAGALPRSHEIDSKRRLHTPGAEVSPSQGGSRMPRMKRNYEVPPTEWVGLLYKHDEELTHVRMLWRRGGGSYRELKTDGPVTSESEPPHSWSARELSQTNRAWVYVEGATREERHEQITQEVAALWAIAADWTHTLGEAWCHFKLIGYRGETMLFEDGKRCQLQADSSVEAVDPHGSTNNTGSNEYLLGYYSHLRESEQRANERNHKLLDKIIADRNKLFDESHRSIAEARETLTVIPDLVSQAGALIKENTDYQRDLLNKIHSHHAGVADAQARALEELMKAERRKNAGDFVVEMSQVGVSALEKLEPLIRDILGKRTGGEPPPKRPEQFERAQQALTKIQYGLRQKHLDKLFDKKEAMSAFMGILHQAAQTKDEREALAVARPAVMLLNCEEFDQVASSAMLEAREFIFHRIAIHNIPYYGEDE